MRHVDAVVMFVSLWLLASMLLDALTPPELNVYMIGPALAPAIFVTAVLYWLRIPALDFAVVFATVWMASEMVLEMITPKPLSPFFALIAVAPLLVVGSVFNFQCWYRSKRRTRPVLSPSISGLSSPGQVSKRAHQA